MARDNAVDVHVLERCALVRDAGPRDDLEILDLRLGVRPSIRLDEAGDHIDAARLERVCFLEHRVGLADTRRGADVDAQPGAILLLQAFEQCLRAPVGDRVRS